MRRLILLTGLAAVYSIDCLADEAWSLNSVSSPTFDLLGKGRSAAGVRGNSLVLDGTGLVKLTDSAKLASQVDGFTLMVWVNPYRLSAGQQMIAAKNRYSLGERQWSVMIDEDNHFRLYVFQGRWVTVSAKVLPKPGHWHLIGVVVRKASAELWVNGRKAGDVELKKPVPQTAAPVTLGGVNDNGRIRQNFEGAIDEVRLVERPLPAEQLATAYQPVPATHSIPNRPDPVRLWTGSQLPSTAEATVLKDVQFRVIKRYEPEADGYGFLHGVAVVWHKGRLYSSFGHNKGSENTFTEEGRFCVSDDGGKSWSSVTTIDPGDDSRDHAVSHGVFLSHNDTLWAFLGSFHQTRKRVHTRAYILNEETGHWQPQGTVIDGGFWPMSQPVRMEDGNWIMPGFIVGNGNPAAVAISQGDDLRSWRAVTIAAGPQVRSMWGESAVIVNGPKILNIARYGSRPIALIAESVDYGRTWSHSVESNLPMAASKPCSGVLSNGQRYLICSTTADGRNRRSPLTIAVSAPGKDTFSRLFVIRHAVFEDGPGESDSGAALSYPYAVEHQGHLYVGYSNNGNRSGNNNSAELAIIPVRSLAVD